MKKLIFLAVLLLSLPIATAAQNAGYVNTVTILEEIPEYTQAQQQLERLKSQYDAQLQNEVKVIENMFNQYQAEKSRLNELQRQSRENEIISKERSLKEREQEIFGQDGIMSAKSKELLDPVKDLVQSAIDYIAKEKGFHMVFDISASQGIIFKDPKADITPDVMKRLGLLN